jgi:hypothetical protein
MKTKSSFFVYNSRWQVKSLFVLAQFLILLQILVSTGYAQEAKYAQSTSYEEADNSKRLLLIPYPFVNDTIGAGIGVAAIAEGYVQKQMLTVASALGSADGTYLGFLMVRNYQVPFMKRLILEPQFSTGEFQDINSFALANPAFPNQRPGGNDSDENNFVEADGSDSWFDFKMKYLLPIGSGKNAIFPTLKTDNGIFVSGDTGGQTWNPFSSGRTYLEVTPFTRKQELEDANKTIQKTTGVDFAIYYDNTDLPVNPSNGSYQRFFYSKDWGTISSIKPWDVAGAEAAKFISLGASESARQRVIALNFWTIDTLSWNDFDIENGVKVYERPPTYKGANLGGLWRMKGYQATRFNDRSAIYYSAEYRHTLKWNPLAKYTMNGKLDVDWIQLTGIVELGRVAPSWSLGELHKDMKWCAGAGIRTMVNNIVVRADFAASEEDGIVQLFIGHPF